MTKTILLEERHIVWNWSSLRPKWSLKSTETTELSSKRSFCLRERLKLSQKRGSWSKAPRNRTKKTLSRCLSKKRRIYRQSTMDSRFSEKKEARQQSRRRKNIRSGWRWICVQCTLETYQTTVGSLFQWIIHWCTRVIFDRGINFCDNLFRDNL